MKMERQQPLMTLGAKRPLSEIEDSESMSTSNNSLISTPITPFASLLPPLNKKPKLMDTSHLLAPKKIVPPHWDTHNIVPSPQLLGISPININPVTINNINPCIAHNITNIHQPIATNNTYYIPIQSNLANNASSTMQINANQSKLSLDTVLSTLSSLNSLNSTQINALKTLILSTNQAPNEDIMDSNNLHANITNVAMPVTSSMAPEFEHAHDTQHTNTEAIAPITPTIAPNMRAPKSSKIPINDQDINSNNTLSNVTLCTKDVKRASCHQCKTKKDVTILFYCTKTRPCSNDSFKRKRCRKKYCESCMAKYYSYNDVSQLRSIKDMERWCWECPACVGLCTCRACKRKKANEAKPKSAAFDTNVADNHRNNNNNTHYVDVRNTQQMQTNRNIRPGVQHNGFVTSLPNGAFRAQETGQNTENNGLITQILANPHLRKLFEQ